MICRFKDWVFYLWMVTARRKTITVLELDDFQTNNLERIGWITRHKGEWFMTRKGSNEFNDFLRKEYDRIGERKRKEN
jgi:hypothetical protein